jgi:hypothetical protein
MARHIWLGHDLDFGMKCSVDELLDSQSQERTYFPNSMPPQTPLPQASHVHIAISYRARPLPVSDPEHLIDQYSFQEVLSAPFFFRIDGQPATL